jgi:putative aldouronate transport system substrate-binding protein
MNRTRIAVLAAVLLICMVPFTWATAQGEASSDERVTIEMFMGNSGVPHPADLDPSDNWAIKIAEDYANVDLIMEVPNYQEWATKHQLLLASGNLPDIVHAQGKNDQENASLQGAWVDLDPYYQQSGVMKKRVSQVAWDLAANSEGLHYAVPMVMSSRDPGYGNIIRWDLLDEYNGGKYPGTIDGYIEFLRWIKDAYPGSVPLGSRFAWGNQLFVVGQVFFNWFGINPYSWSVYNGNVESGFTRPEMKAALAVWKQCYEEGLLDQEFATSDGARFYANQLEKQTAFMTNATDQIIPGYTYKPEDGIIRRFTPPLEEYPSAVVDEKYTWGFDIFPIAGHRTSIAASSKKIDRAWKVLEAFASDEMYDVVAWGREGKEYNIVNGERIPTDRLYLRDMEDADAHYWTLHLGIINGFWPTDVKYKVAEMRAPELWRAAYDSAKWTMDRARENGLNLGSFIPANPEVSKKSGEINPFISGVIAQVIMGQMSFDEFDNKVEEFEREFGFIYEFYEDYMNKNKDELRSFGVKMVDW